MSAGYCKECGFIVDLNARGYLITHRACKGSLTKPTEPPTEDERFAFSADPVQRHCPTCGQLVVINTMGGAHRMGWRYSYHKMPHLKAVQSWGQPPGDCPQSGQLVGHPKPLGADATQIQVQGQDGQWGDLDGVTGIRIDPF